MHNTWCDYEVPRMILLCNSKGATWLIIVKTFLCEFQLSAVTI